MKTLIETISADVLTARKNRDTFTVTQLATLLGEAKSIGKNDGNRETTDAEVIALVKKFIKGIDECLAIKTGDTSVMLEEKRLLEKYIPKQLGEAELTFTIEAIAKSISAKSSDMGKIMAALKSQYDGQYDGKLASAITKKVLANAG